MKNTNTEEELAFDLEAAVAAHQSACDPLEELEERAEQYADEHGDTPTAGQFRELAELAREARRA